MSSPIPTPNGDGLFSSEDFLVSEKGFKISIWVCTSLCIVVLALRFSIRLASFRRLFIEDYLMLFSLLTLIAVSAVLQRFLGYIYTIISVQNGLIPLGPDFPDQLVLGLRADGVVLILNTIGIWAIKLSFLSFFLGFGRQIRVYLVLWWISLVLVVTCGVAQLGLIPYRCVFGTLWQMTMECSTKSSLIQSYTVNKVSVSIDVVSDAIIVGFPTFIIWKTNINLRQKLLLTAIFLLVGFTIAVTIIRGSIFGGVYESIEDIDRKVLNTEWLLFWFFVQYIVSFIIACIISFRSLWVNKERRLREQKMRAEKRQRMLRSPQEHSPMGAEGTTGWKSMHDTVMQTLWELEGADMEWDGSYLIKHEPPSGRLTVDFSQWDNSTFGFVGGTSTTISTNHSRENSQAKVTSSV